MFGLFDNEIGQLQNNAANTAGFIAMMWRVLVICFRNPWLFIVIPLLPWILLSQSLPTLIFGGIFFLGGWRLRTRGY